LLVVGCWFLVVDEIARENDRKVLNQRILDVRVAQVAYFCVWPWFFSRLTASGVGTAAGG
jgi:hypothetical protein